MSLFVFLFRPSIWNFPTSCRRVSFHQPTLLKQWKSKRHDFGSRAIDALDPTCYMFCPACWCQLWFSQDPVFDSSSAFPTWFGSSSFHDICVEYVEDSHQCSTSHLLSPICTKSFLSIHALVQLAIVLAIVVMSVTVNVWVGGFVGKLGWDGRERGHGWIVTSFTTMSWHAPNTFYEMQPEGGRPWGVRG